ncbi:hypothetical protein C7I87_24125 [Mesorhizobium sp. SARCC-RB16n]|uniref:hypothetical protein n=1 Tax=Mesorhizobium sp. SARCC-RB16n TaxID=2116687 RepID=UPI00122F4BFB|nr:hypothetical protein [Mesorhizobium sp. SARCC-RB16n]KAA3448031.1 hypothetical protein C7I87_24125 [Mesorhizobium sp. SARCC-RB16n]
MNRDRRNSFGRRQSCACPAPVAASPIADESRCAEEQYDTSGEATRQTNDRIEALGFIICRLDELRQMTASYGLEPLGYLLDVAFTESCDAIRRERSCTQSETVDPAIRTDDVS